MNAFLAVMDGYTLQDLLANRDELQQVFGELIPTLVLEPMTRASEAKGCHRHNAVHLRILSSSPRSIRTKSEGGMMPPSFLLQARWIKAEEDRLDSLAFNSNPIYE